MGTHLKNKIDNLTGRAARIAEIYGERGRKSEGDILRGMATAVSPTTTKSQAIERFQKFTRDYSVKIIDSTLKGMPDSQRIGLLFGEEGLNFDPQWIVVDTPKGIKQKYTQKAGVWGVYNPKTGKYDEVGD